MGDIVNFNREERRKSEKENRKWEKEYQKRLKASDDIILSRLKGQEQMVPSMTEVDFSGLLMPFITLFNKPLDFPENIVGRVFDINKPTNTCCIYKSIDEAREDAYKAGFRYIVPRMAHDDIHILEAYIR